MSKRSNEWFWFKVRLREPWRFFGANGPWGWLADRVPRRLAYFCAIRVGAHATVGKYGDTVVPELHFMDALKRWDES